VIIAMPKLQLAFVRKDLQVLGAESVYYERIRALLAIGNSGQVKKDALVDTGSILSVFPEKVWKQFQSDITWLHTAGGPTHLPDWLTKVTGLGAQPVDCGIGRVKIQIVEMPSLRYSPAVEILAKFPLDQGKYSQILLGLGGDAFSYWKLYLDCANQEAWVEY
jgi:hypothetical protein